MPRTWLSRLARRAASAYVAGPALDDALEMCRRVACRGFAGTVGFWNRDGQAPEQVADAQLAAVDALGREALDCYISVKAPPLHFSRELSAGIVARARGQDVKVHFDSHGPASVEPTFAMIEDGVARHPRLGCTLPGRWRRSLRDAAWAADLGLDVRVVKGQFPDLECEETDPRRGFLAVVDRLAGRARFVAVATHDAELARMALGRLVATRTACEAELLFGLPLREVTRVASKVGVRVRLYIPYGHGWLPYVLSEARSHPGRLWWLARDLIRGRLRNPVRVPDVAGRPAGAPARRETSCS